MIQTYFNNIIEQVPNYLRFLKIEEVENIINTFKKFTNIDEAIIGKTAENKPLRMFTLGNGKKKALIIGVPHSDEPLGSLVALHLINWMARNPQADFFNWKWLIIPVLEQRGMAMNQGWFNNHGSLEKTAKFYYREPTEDQYEWTFPFEYRDYKWMHPRPESNAIKEVLKKEKPDLLCNLHHCGFYNTYFYFSKDLPAAYSRLKKLSNLLELPLSKSNPDISFSRIFSPGFYQMYGVKDYIDYYKMHKPERLLTMRRGASSDEWYLDAVGGFSFNCEVPLFNSTINRDNQSSNVKLKKLLKKSEIKKSNNLYYCIDLLKKIEPFFPLANSLLLNSVLKTLANTKISLYFAVLKIQSIKDRFATNFELYENGIMVDVENLLILGQIWRIIKNISEFRKNNEISNLLKQVNKMILLLVNDISLAGKFETIPLQRLIKMQLGSILIIADVLAKNN